MRVAGYVINLKQDTEKWAHMQETVAAAQGVIPFERYNAIYGKNLTEEERARVSTSWCFKHCSESMIGCALSHMNVWKDAVRRNLDYVVVFEDDIEMTMSPELWPGALMQAIRDNEGVDVLLLGSMLLFESPLYKRALGALTGMQAPSNNDTNFTGTIGYVASKEGLQKLLSQHPRVAYHVDLMISMTSALDIRRVEPPLVIHAGHDESNNVGSAFSFLESAQIRVHGLPLSWTMNVIVGKIGGFYVLVGHLVLGAVLVVLGLVMGLAILVRKKINARAKK